MSQEDTSQRELPELRAKRFNWPAFRDWLNAAVAVGALLIAIVTFWTTTRISGFEDYLKSEVGRRNSELNSLTSQADRIRTLADARSERLSELQTATDSLVATALGAQERISQTQGELARVRSETLAAQQTLLRTESRAASLERQEREQRDIIELFKIQRTYESAIMQTTFDLRLGRDDGTLSGSEMVSAIKRFQPASAENDLLPYFARIRQNADRTCYALSQFRQDIPVALPNPAKPTISYARGTSSREIERLRVRAIEDWNKRWEEAGTSQRARMDAQHKASTKIMNMTFSCICDALTDERNGRDAICPGTKVEN